MADSQALCQSCGLCCDGQLFRTVPLRDDEVETAIRSGLQLVARTGGGRAFQQPCAALVDRRCGVYADRPATCREFRCALLNAHEDGSVSLDDALDIVRQTRQSVEASRRRLISLHFVRSPL